MTHNLPKIIGKQRRDRTLVLLYWRYGSKKVIISEEKLIYDLKDLIALIGGEYLLAIHFLICHSISLLLYFIYFLLNPKCMMIAPF